MEPRDDDYVLIENIPVDELTWREVRVWAPLGTFFFWLAEVVPTWMDWAVLPWACELGHRFQYRAYDRWWRINAPTPWLNGG